MFEVTIDKMDDTGMSADDIREYLSLCLYKTKYITFPCRDTNYTLCTTCLLVSLPKLMSICYGPQLLLFQQPVCHIPPLE